MRNSILLLGTLALVTACSRDRATESGSTTVTGASTGAGEVKPVTVEEIRVAILDQNPNGQEALSSVFITSDNGVITLKGTVPDDDTRVNAVNRIKRMPNVKSVHDELTVAPKGAATMQAQPMDESAKDAAKGGMPGATPASTKTKTTDAIRARMIKDKAAPSTVITALGISDDGTVVIISGNVRDDAMHDSLMSSAQKAAGDEHVQDNLHVVGK